MYVCLCVFFVIFWPFPKLHLGRIRIINGWILAFLAVFCGLITSAFRCDCEIIAHFVICSLLFNCNFHCMCVCADFWSDIYNVNDFNLCL